ncbi:Prorsd1 (predicted) [Pycnogonum litorale]
MASNESSCVTKDELLKKFDELGIEAETVDHVEVFTVDAMLPHIQHLDGIISKNLFLKDKKKNLYLLSTKHDRTVSLNDVSKQVDASGGLRLADESLLYKHLGVKQGCVTAFALINDVSKTIRFLCDSCILDSDKKVYFHPLTNSATTGVSSDDFKTFLKYTGHEPVSVKFT